MTLSQRVLEARTAWQETPQPFENFREDRGRVLTYGIECDLDHQASYISGMLRALEANNPHWDFALRAGIELRDLHDLRERTEALELPEMASGPLLRYIEATERLLQAILDQVADSPR